MEKCLKDLKVLKALKDLKVLKDVVVVKTRSGKTKPDRRKKVKSQEPRNRKGQALPESETEKWRVHRAIVRDNHAKPRFWTMKNFNYFAEPAFYLSKPAKPLPETPSSEGFPLGKPGFCLLHRPKVLKGENQAGPRARTGGSRWRGPGR